MSAVDIVVNDTKKESYVGKQLNDSTTKKVIVLVLCLIFSFPLFTLSSYVTEPASFRWGLDLLLRLHDSKMTAKQKQELFQDVATI